MIVVGRVESRIDLRSMNKRLEKVFAEASKLSETEQVALAEWLLLEIASERRWENSVFDSSDRIAEMANEALAEHRKDKTRKLDPDEL